MVLGEKIRLARLFRGYTQENMASMLEISATAYRKIEKNTDVNGKRLNQIAAVLKMSEEEIKTIEDKMFFNSFNGTNHNVLNHNIYDSKALAFELEKANLELHSKNLEIKNLQLQILLLEEKLKNK